MIGLRRWLVVLVLMTGMVALSAQDFGDGLGVRGGVGTDISFGGVAYGIGVNHLFQEQIEIGLQLYYGEFVEGELVDYEETTEITAFTAMANYLYGYTWGESGAFFVGGVGLGYVNMYWVERSSTDTSLGTPCCGGGSKQDFEGGVGGVLLNIGAGYAFAGGLDLRAEIPVMIVFGDTGDATGVIPLFTLTAGYRFSF